MALEALSSSSNELFNIVIYDTISATPCISMDTPTTTNPNFLTSPLDHINDNIKHYHHHHHHNQEADQLVQNINGAKSQVLVHEPDAPPEIKAGVRRASPAVGPTGGAVRKKRRRKPRVCKNKEEAETQRMTHIAVERNRRKQMNEHLAVLRSLMPESYVQRGDQASIVGGAIEFVKELEHLLQSLEAQKLQLNLQGMSDNNIGGSDHNDHNNHDHHDNQENSVTDMKSSKFLTPPFSQFFVYPQYTWSQISNKYTSKTKAAIADIEVTLIETHASLRILSRRSTRQLSKLVAGFQTLHLTILHLNVTTISPLVLYSVSVKVEEECLLNSVDDIAAAVHHMLRIIEEEAAFCSS